MKYLKKISGALCLFGTLCNLHAALPALESFRAGENTEGLQFTGEFVAPVEWSADSWRGNLYLDTDNNPATGYRGTEGNWLLGADLLIQGRKLHFFGGETQQAWGWMPGGELAGTLEGRHMTVTLPFSLYLIKRGTAYAYVYQLDNQPGDILYHPAPPWQQPGTGTVSQPPPLAPVAPVAAGDFDPAPIPAPVTRTNQRGIFADSQAGESGLRNPERGFRLMTEIANLHDVADPYQVTFRDWQGQFEKYPFVTLEQAYCWLLTDSDRPISETKLEALRQDLLKFRAAGVKLLLRFAYERNHVDPFYGPTIETILCHMEQLKPILHEFQDVIYVLQSGFIGAYGEWHSSAEGLQNDLAAKQRYTALC